MKTIRYKNVDNQNNQTWESISIYEQKDIEDKITEMVNKTLESYDLTITSIINGLSEKVSNLERETERLTAENSTLNSAVNKLEEDLYDEEGNLKVNAEDIYTFIISNDLSTAETNKFWIDSSTEGDYILKYYNAEKSTWLPVRIAWGTTAAVPEE